MNVTSFDDPMVANAVDFLKPHAAAILEFLNTKGRESLRGRWKLESVSKTQALALPDDGFGAVARFSALDKWGGTAGIGEFHTFEIMISAEYDTVVPQFRGPGMSRHERSGFGLKKADLSDVPKILYGTNFMPVKPLNVGRGRGRRR